MEDSGKVFQEVEQITDQYRHLAYLSSKLYFTLSQFSSVNRLY